MSRFSVRKPYTIFVIVIVIFMLGAISYMNMTTDLLPKIDLPYVIVTTAYPGASPEEVEQQVTKPLEQTLATTSNIKSVSSESNENYSVVILEFYQDVNMDSIIIEMDGKIDMLISEWGDGIGSPMVLRMNPDALPVMLVAIDVDGQSIFEISETVTNDIMPEFEKIDGVASVEASGLLYEQIEVTINQQKIEGLNDRILAAVDKDLLEVQDEIDDAKEQLEDGKKQLSEQNIQGSEQIAQAETALNDGKILIAQKETELQSAIALLTLQQQAYTALIEQMTRLKDELLKYRQQAVDALQNPAPAEEGEQPTLPQVPELPDDWQMPTLPQIPDGWQPPEDWPDFSIIQTPEGQIGVIDQAIPILDQEIAEMKAALVEVGGQITELSAARGMIDAQKTEITSGEQQLITGKASLSDGIGKAQSELAVAEAMLNSKTEQFEAARDQALEQASLSGVVTRELISQLLSAQNFSMPAGYISEDGFDYLVKVGEEIGSMEQLKSLVLMDLGLDEIDTIRLEDVADIVLTDNSEQTYARINGNDGIVLTMQKQSMYSTTEVSEKINETIARLTGENESLHVTALMDQGVYINIVVDNVINNLLYGAILAAVILLIFLRSIKPTIIVGLSIPISVVFAIVLMYFSGVTLNIISLAGLALGVGMLVDNSIVVIENIFRLRSEGADMKRAAIEGAKQVSGAIIASTLTTVSVFLPIVFIEGLTRQIFTDMGLTIAYSLLASLIVALTVVPAMSSRMLTKSEEKKFKGFEKFKEGYGKVLAFVLRKKFIVIVPVVALFVLSLANVLSMGTGYIPAIDSDQLTVAMEMPQGSTFDDTKENTEELIDRILTVEDVETVGALAGGNVEIMGDGNDEDQSTLYIILRDERELSSSQVADIIRDKTEDMEGNITVNSSNMDLTALMGSGIEVVVKGPDLDVLQQIARDIAAELEKTEGTIDVSDGLKDAVQEVRVTVDKQKAIEEGLTVAQVYMAISGKISAGTTATNVTIDNKDYPVVVADLEGKTLTKEELANFMITADKNGEKEEVRLSDIATIEEGVGMSSIGRRSQERFISVTAGVDSEHNVGLVSREFNQQIASYDVPEGYAVNISGENQTIMDAIGDVLYMIAIAIGLVYLIMVAQFQSLMSPFIVMFTIPLAVTGGLLALQILGFDLTMIALLGFLILAGIVVNNGIVLVDFINQLRREGMPKKEAIVEAGKTRMRPILMTTLTTVFGLTTMALGIGDGAEMLQPMAIVTVFGLLYATILTLFVIPVLYDAFNRKELPAALDEQKKPRVLYRSKRPG